MRHESHSGISPTLHAALFTVETHGPITAGQLARHENVTKPTATRTIRTLLEQGLITRTADPLDGRVTWLDVTSEGKKLLQRARRRTDEYLARHLKNLTADERELLDRASELLQRMAERDARV